MLGPRHAIILAAGRGQRMMPLTDAVPKPMAPYRGSTLIAHGIEKIARKIEKVHVTVGYKGAMLAQHVIQLGAHSVINTEGQTNSWWIFNSLLKYVDEPMCVLTCDNVVELDFDLLMHDYHLLNRPACMLVPVVPAPGLDGDFIFHENRFVRKLSRTEASEIYCSGIQILNPCEINRLVRAEGDFYSVWSQLIAKDQLVVSSVYPREWFAVDTIEQLVSLNRQHDELLLATGTP
jgi:NDP-sugar pyrophosphorylase family protein